MEVCFRSFSFPNGWLVGSMLMCKQLVAEVKTWVEHVLVVWSVTDWALWFDLPFWVKMWPFWLNFQLLPCSNGCFWWLSFVVWSLELPFVGVAEFGSSSISIGLHQVWLRRTFQCSSKPWHNSCLPTQKLLASPILAMLSHGLVWMATCGPPSAISWGAWLKFEWWQHCLWLCCARHSEMCESTRLQAQTENSLQPRRFRLGSFGGLPGKLVASTTWTH